MGQEFAGWVQSCLYYLRYKGRCPAVSDMKPPGLPFSGDYPNSRHSFEYVSVHISNEGDWPVS